MTGQLNWFKGGIALAIAFLAAIVLMKPIGVSTQFVILDGLLWSTVSEGLIVKDPGTKTGYASSNAYLDKKGGAYAKNAVNPLNYGFVFVLSMVLGAFVSAKTNGPKVSEWDKIAPKVWCSNFGDSPLKRYIAAFCGGVLVLYGARLAGGCTSGHMMSGVIQTSVSGYLFAVSAFVTGVPVALLMYDEGEV